MDKLTLDNLLDKHRAQPVGDGYIDIIVVRDHYKAFIEDLITKGFLIRNVSWWEWCAGDRDNDFGMGGSRSIYYEGWFSEIPENLDDFNFSKDTPQHTIYKSLDHNRLRILLLHLSFT